MIQWLLWIKNKFRKITFGHRRFMNIWTNLLCSYFPLCIKTRIMHDWKNYLSNSKKTSFDKNKTEKKIVSYGLHISTFSFLVFITYDAAYSWQLQFMKYGTLLTGVSCILIWKQVLLASLLWMVFYSFRPLNN